MTMQWKDKHFLSVDQINSISDLQGLWDFATHVGELLHRRSLEPALSQAVLANLFFEVTTRTRFSFSCAFQRLGGSVIELGSVESTSLSKGESLEDTSRMINGYADIVVVRHGEVGAVQQFADVSSIPVINGGNGIDEHPTQALLDVYTMLKELKKTTLKNLSICMVGDLKHGRTVHSLSKLLSLFGGVHFYFVSPSQLKMPINLINLLKQRNNTVTETEVLKEGVKNAEVVYVTRIQEERFTSPDEFAECAGRYFIDKDFYESDCLLQPLLMHPLPRNSRLAIPEIHPNLDNHYKLAMFRQAHNGVLVRMALFCLILGVKV